MARKRLSDLLREEVQKPAEGEAETPAPESNGRSRTTARSRKPAGTSSAKSTTARSTAAKSADSSVAEASEVGELKAALERSQQQEASLKQELATLQSSLGQQDTLIKSLKADLAKTEALKTELEQAKKAALQLAEENTQLKQNLKPAPSQKPPVEPPPSPAKATKSSAALTQQEMIIKRQTESLVHPVFPGSAQPGHLTEQDLGWVD